METVHSHHDYQRSPSFLAREDDSYLPLLRKIMAEMPDADCETWRDELERRMSPEETRAALLVCVRNEYRNSTRARPTATREERTRRRAAVEEGARSFVRRQSRVTLDSIVPGVERPLRDCTGDEIGKLGGLFSLIAEAVKPRQKVGDVLNNADLERMQSKPKK